MLTVGPSEPWTGPGGTELELSGVNIWDGVWSEAEVQDVTLFCSPIPPGNVFAWGQVMTLPGAGITQTLTAPSVCDGELIEMSTGLSINLNLICHKIRH